MLRFRLKLLGAVLVAAGALILGLVVADIYQDRQHSLAITGPVEVLEQPRPQRSGLPPNPVIAVLNPADQVKVLRITYGKDYMAIKVGMADGRVGYVIYGDNVQLKR